MFTNRLVIQSTKRLNQSLRLSSSTTGRTSVVRLYSSGQQQQQHNQYNQYNQNQKQKINWKRINIGCGLAVLATSVVLAADETTAHQPNWREKIFTNYQDRIREFSTPEKIFQTFASINKNGEYFMTLDDFVRAVLPHQFKSSSPGSTKNKSLDIKEVPISFKIADVDGDGLISFGEFMFFSTLLSIPEKSVDIAFKIFDVNHDNSIDVNEFTKIFRILKNQSAFTKSSTGTSQKSLLSQGWVDYLFGKHGDNSLTLEKFKSLLEQVRRDVLQLEFHIYDPKSTGQISQRDFGLLISSYANVNMRNSYLKSVESLPTTVNNTGSKGVTFEQFVGFNRLLNKLDEVGLSIDLYKGINQPFTKSEFKYIAKVICQFEPSNEVVDTVYAIFDADKNGDLSKDEFVSVMRRRKYRGLEESRDTGFVARLEKIYQVITGKL
ncbi:hypothetical protein PPL_05995 [Heterostelium album PN500]|uniref:EF-hand domain-containing protein n=1 Tax=Heterostelium pallidum (strain ATCC 26659 / Pp 5 / PN500) TaxID=670386 RepID=D3BBX5_HETP5|nr:hypothetical protein PPL_05995 [Heterostelium album PN500]EFA81158.1 hypothetical protein PPL_05995 [Heterostelium album PN500]|eukprot:XP_020433276.1 hypothetical protein PPL_05995 [Heterostelium album PN500]